MWINLLEKKVDYIFQPIYSEFQRAKDNPTNNPNCPWIQSVSFMVAVLHSGWSHPGKIPDAQPFISAISEG